MNTDSTFFHNNKLPFKFDVQLRWLTLSRIELFLLDKQAQYSVQQEQELSSKIYLYLQVVSNIKEEFLPTLSKFYEDVDVVEEFKICSKEINALAELIDNDFSSVEMTVQ